MFRSIRAEVDDRTFHAEQCLRMIETLERNQTSEETATYKGLLFVHLYGIHEYAIVSAVQTALSSIVGAGVQVQRVHRHLIPLVLHAQFTSATEARRDKVWLKRLELIGNLESADPMPAATAAIFPNDGTHFRHGQIQTIWNLFGIEGPTLPDPRLISRIDELVGNRNLIAHGRLTANEVGRDYSAKDLGRINHQGCLHDRQPRDHGEKCHREDQGAGAECRVSGENCS